MKLHLVDATFELFRAFYSPGRGMEFAPDGRPVNAVHGLVDSMLSLLREPDVSHIAAATDHVIESWRNDVFPDYKSSVGLPQELLSQFDDAERALRALGIVTWAMVEDEADDAIATAVARFSGDERLEQIVICSVDKDLAQCVDDDRVVLRDRIRRVTYDQAGVITKFGVGPESIPDYLALVGDHSDGYPGLAGWGARSSAAILMRFGHLDAIPESPLDWDVPLRGASQLAAVLRDHKAEALLYRRLARLSTDAAITGTLDDLAWGGVPRSEFLAICAELGFERIRERVHRWADQPSV
jgi:5'-3' exonuclease